MRRSSWASRLFLLDNDVHSLGNDVHSLGSVSPCPSLPVLESFNTPVSQSSSHAEEVVPGSVDSWEHGHGLAEFLESEGIWF